jgi:hypothetical protein
MREASCIVLLLVAGCDTNGTCDTHKKQVDVSSAEACAIALDAPHLPSKASPYVFQTNTCADVCRDAGAPLNCEFPASYVEALEKAAPDAGAAACPTSSSRVVITCFNDCS